MRLSILRLILASLMLSIPGEAALAAAGIQSGTGFFVTNTGHIITNEHVVRGCRKVRIRGSVNSTDAEVVDTDSQFDIALLRTASRPSRVANIRASDDALNINDPVMVIGYPLERGVSGIYKVVYSTVIGLQGPMNEAHWIQFADAALQGNSGGPLLDSSGNVIGVITGKTQMSMRNEQTGQDEVISTSDVAISLPVLKAFLNKNQVYFRTMDSQAYYSVERVENIAKFYIVNIHCQPGAH